MCDPSVSDIPLPSGWAKNVKSAVLHVISLAHYAIVAARGWAANSINARVRPPPILGACLPRAIVSIPRGIWGPLALFRCPVLPGDIGPWRFAHK